MALLYPLLTYLRQLRSHVSKDAPVLACLGYPDCLLTGEMIDEVLGEGMKDRLNYREDSKDIIAWHGLKGQVERLATTESVIEALGYKLVVYDIVASRGPEIILDLNIPIDPLYCNSADIVFDGGTMEHCFNVGQTICNILNMTKQGGFILHANPMHMLNHGFFNFSPTFYHDFYSQNGHQIVDKMLLTSGTPLELKIEEAPPVDRFRVNGECGIVVGVRKTHDRPPQWPMQTKYLNLSKNEV